MEPVTLFALEIIERRDKSPGVMVNLVSVEHVRADDEGHPVLQFPKAEYIRLQDVSRILQAEFLSLGYLTIVGVEIIPCVTGAAYSSVAIEFIDLNDCSNQEWPIPEEGEYGIESHWRPM